MRLKRNRRRRRNGTRYYDRLRPGQYTSRLIQTHGVDKAEKIVRKGTKRFGKEHAGWWTAAHDIVQGIRLQSVKRNSYRRRRRKTKR